MSATSDAAPGSRQAALLEHLEGLYLLAQGLTPDVDAAKRLVADTYFQAAAQLPATFEAATLRHELMALMLQIHRDAQVFAPPDEGAPGSEALDRLRLMLAELTIDRALPLAFAELPEEQRLVLLLCEAQDLDVDETARLLEAQPAHVEQQRAAAFATLRQAVEDAASEAERHLLASQLPEDWLRESIHRTIWELFDAPPNSLREAVVEARPAQPVPALAARPSVPQPPRLALPAPERPVPEERPRRRLVLRGLGVAVLMAAIAFGGYFLLQTFDAPPETNLVLLAARTAPDVQPTLLTNSAEQAERYVRDELGWRLTLPTIDRAPLAGVGLHELAADVTVPVFLFQDTLGTGSASRPIALYVYNYALLDAHRDRIRLAPDVLRQIQNDARFDLYDLDDRRQVLIWRYRDDIFLAVSSADAGNLRERIVFPS